jgi:mannose-1-phosphate guanylyltransferase
LWPLSNDTRSKQFLKVLSGPGGRLESMVQRVWRQLELAGLAGETFIATGRGQVDMIHSQIGDGVRIIEEPERRDTFAAIALSCTCLYAREGVGLDEVVAFLPVDPYADDEFFRTLGDLDGIVRDSGAELALIGVKPTYPSEKYGYIVPIGDEAGEGAGRYARVGRFVEKPGREDAERLMKQRALWNCGVFAFRLGYMMGLLAERDLPLSYGEMVKRFASLPNISFDREVVERAGSVVTAFYDGCWKDLGTWNTLTEEIAEPIIGNGTIGEGSQGTHVINELDIPVAVLGIPDAVVSASPDGILVSHKEASPKVKDLIGHLERRPMYEERRWGSYRVLDYKRYPEGTEVLTKRLYIAEGRHLSYQVHEKRCEVWTVVSGEGEVVMNERLYAARPGDVFRISAGARHSVRAAKDLEIIEVQTGPELTEADIVRLCQSWEEIEQRMLAPRMEGIHAAP